MDPEEEAQTTLSKWPFVVGDVLLVGMALAIAVLGDWQLTNWQVASCVMAVALGAALFVLPYIVEFRVRVAEEAQDKASDLRVLRRQLQAVEEAILSLDGRVRAREDNDATQVVPPDELIDRVSKITKQADRRFKDLDGQFKDFAVRQDELEKALKSLREQLADTANPAPAAPSETPPPTKPQRERAPSLVRPQRAARKRQRPAEPRLLRRAITETSEGSSSAVTRIIESRSAPETEVTREPEMLFADDPAPKPRRKKRVKKSDTVLTATVFIGIGNKPYLRGSGGGLSWEQGVAMEFQEIGKWRWVAPEELEAPIEVQIFCNDEDADQSGVHILKPGGNLEIAPKF